MEGGQLLQSWTAVLHTPPEREIRAREENSVTQKVELIGEQTFRFVEQAFQYIYGR